MTSTPSGSSANALSSVLPRREEWPLGVLPSARPRRRSGPVVLAAAAGRGLLSTLRADPRQAVQEDSIRCLVCGGSFRQLTNTHLRVHRLNADEYKQRL